jgi:protein-tyrosine-phosphatase
MPRMDHATPRLLFVCSGNICRSPLAEAMARAALDKEVVDAIVQSCGTSALTGQPAENGARSAAADLGLSLDAHRAQPVTRDLIASASLVVCVTDRHRDHIRQFFPHQRAKIVSFDEVTGLGDIPDPYGGDDANYRALRDQLQKGMPKIVERIKVGRTEAGEPKMPST